MHRKGLYKIAVGFAGPTPNKPKATPPAPRMPSHVRPGPPPGEMVTPLHTPPANDRLLTTKAITAHSGGRLYKNLFPNVFRMYDSKGTAIPVNVMTDTPYYINTIGWTPPTDRTFNYSEFYNAQVDDPQGWAKYQEYRRKLPIEDINKVTKAPGSWDWSMITDQYSSADDFVNTVGQGPRFRWYDVRTAEDAESAIEEGLPRDHTPIYEIYGGSALGQGSYSPFSTSAPHGSIILSEDATKGLVKPPIGILDFPSFTTTLDGEDNKLVTASRHYLPLPQMIIAGHEMAHALTRAASAPGTDVRLPRRTRPKNGLSSEARGYSYKPTEQVQAVHTLNKSYQALLNSLAKGNHKDMPSEFRKIIDKYPAYGSKEQFMARNDALLAHPELAVKYLGIEPSRALAQLKQLKHNAWLQRQGMYTSPRTFGQRIRDIGYPDVGDAQKHLDFFNDNYFADASFNGNAEQRHA